MAGRVYITGASGCGATTLGRAVARALIVPLIDTDDHYWAPTDPPFTEKFPVPERRARMERLMSGQGWVVSGEIEGWGDAMVAGADLIVFLTLARPLRLIRLRVREAARFGPRIAPGGDMEAIHRSFLDWAMSYDDAVAKGRSRLRQEAWLARQPAPVLRLVADKPLNLLADAVLAALPV
jgi:adenylate kinase family enzyme